MRTILGILFLIVSIPLGLYMWLKWGWYDGFVMVFNAVMNEPKNAQDFAWGIFKILLGGIVGAVSFWITFLVGSLLIGVNNNFRGKNNVK